MLVDINTSAIEIRHLRLVVALSARESMTSAARLLRLTQPALSHQLKDLESHLGRPLFVRTTRRMVPTELGERFTRFARDFLAQLDTFERQARSGDFSAERGIVRVALETSTAYHWFPRVCAAFRERWPAVSIEIAGDVSRDPLSALRDGSVDVVVAPSRSRDVRVRSHALFEDETVLIVAAEHRLRGRAFVEPGDLADEHLLVESTDRRAERGELDPVAPFGNAAFRTSVVPVTQTILELVAAGLGVSIQPRWAVADALRARSVHAVSLSDLGIHRGWFALTRADEPTPPCVFDLVGLLDVHIADTAPARARIA